MSEHMRLPDRPIDVDWSTAQVNNIWESRGWHQHVVRGASRDTPDGSDFGTANNRRNIVLSLSSDGFVPHKWSTRSITPITAMILNLPENLRHRASNLLLVGLIPGPKAPKSMNPYLDIVVNELRHLYTEGFSVRDPTLPLDHPPIKVRVKLLYTCADYPAHNKMNSQQGAGATFGCIKCHIEVRTIET